MKMELKIILKRGPRITKRTQYTLEKFAHLSPKRFLLWVLFARVADMSSATLLFLAYPDYFIKYEINRSFVNLLTKGDYIPTVTVQLSWVVFTVGFLALVMWVTRRTHKRIHASEYFLLAWSTAFFMFGWVVVYSLWGALTNVIGLLFATLEIWP